MDKEPLVIDNVTLQIMQYTSNYDLRIQIKKIQIKQFILTPVSTTSDIGTLAEELKNGLVRGESQQMKK